MNTCKDVGFVIVVRDMETAIAVRTWLEEEVARQVGIEPRAGLPSTRPMLVSWCEPGKGYVMLDRGQVEMTVEGLGFETTDIFHLDAVTCGAVLEYGSPGMEPAKGTLWVVQNTVKPNRKERRAHGSKVHKKDRHSRKRLT